ALFLNFNVIPCKCFAENRNQWAITREENTIEAVVFVLMFCGGVEANQCLTSSRNAGKKADGFELAIARCSNDLINRTRRYRDIWFVCFVPCDVLNRMSLIQCKSCFDDSGGGLIAALFPAFRIYVRF